MWRCRQLVQTCCFLLNCFLTWWHEFISVSFQLNQIIQPHDTSLVPQSLSCQLWVRRDASCHPELDIVNSTRIFILSWQCILCAQPAWLMVVKSFDVKHRQLVHTLLIRSSDSTKSYHNWLTCYSIFKPSLNLSQGTRNELWQSVFSQRTYSGALWNLLTFFSRSLFYLLNDVFYD